MRIIHLPMNLEREVSMPSNAFYIGAGIVNLTRSKLYIDLEENQYKAWLWKEIKAKTFAYQELLAMKETIVKGDELILVCSCDKKELCNSNTVKKALFYFLEQQEIKTASFLPTSWQDYIKTVIIDESKLHDFCFWLSNNQYYQEQLNFHQLWLRFLCLNF